VTNLAAVKCTTVQVIKRLLLLKLISALESSTNETPCVYDADNTTNICNEFGSAESDLDLTKDRHILSTERKTHKDELAKLKSEKVLVMDRSRGSTQKTHRLTTVHQLQCDVICARLRFLNCLKLKVKAIPSCQMSFNNSPSTWRNIPEVLDFHHHCSENLPIYTHILQSVTSIFFFRTTHYTLLICTMFFLGIARLILHLKTLILKRRQ